ncbi:TonB-dependent receptor plug domain-containing protein [Sphingobacterium lumbrici]|uniref:TonB-dependent receptor plug domain-containing protein n=1 Tax=Sphingobacterium lumbrici TaxID=2559600 RepID=UPI0011294D48|nr:TonB-dependent receptor plug domain-containing protein [Sphingobacterium lumbrici]
MRAFSLLVVFSVFFSIVYAQDIQKTLEKADDFYQSNPQEKLYLHLDKYAYTAGETIWFKAYTTIGIHNFFSNLSGIANVELISPSEEVVAAIKIPLISGLGIGDFLLNDTIVEGSYRIRAYTNWMRNYDDTYFYDRTIQISNGRLDNVLTTTSVTSSDKDNIYAINLKSLAGNALSKTSIRYEVLHEGKVVDKGRTASDEAGLSTIKVDKKYKAPLLKLRFENMEKMNVTKLIKASAEQQDNNLQIFPEGGKLLANVVNNIGIKAIRPNGLGIKAKLVVLAGVDTVLSVETNELGMGASSLFVRENDVFKAFAEFADGSKSEVSVPSIEKSGYSLLVNSLNSRNVYAQLNVSPDLIDQKEMYFVVQHLGQVYFVSKQKLTKSELVYAVDKDKLPTGVVTISILNDQFMPVVERAFFSYKPENILPMEITLDKESYGSREKVDVNLNVGTEGDSIRFAALSASVVDLSKIKDEYSVAPNILSTLLLSSDLKGFIENPGYYFNNEVNTADLDFLMLTQGWRSMDWRDSEIAATHKFEPEKSLKIAGYTRKLGRKAAEPKASVQLISTKNFMDFIDTLSADDGYFEFDELMFPDSIKFLISAKNEKGKNNIDIEINAQEKSVISANRNVALERYDINDFYKDEINNSKQFFAELERNGLMERAIDIEEVVVRAKKRRAAENSSNLNGSGNADQIISAEELSTCASLEMCLVGRLMGVTFINGIPHNTRGNLPMQVVLDGMYIEADQISMINVSDIESVEVLRNVNYTAIYGSYGSNGLLIITSKTGASAMRRYTPKGIVTIQPQGIHVNRTFYKPVYDVSDETKFNRDLRTTIHWEPIMVADKDGQTSFQFFTSDGKGKYLMVIEGIDFGGRVGRKAIAFEVK